ncbi:MAG TPA: YraN family protein [archaeon]|nr:YraN family protein [archaeon]
MSYRQRKGLCGEEAAARYLEDRGFEILEHRYRFGHKEIDLIARKDELVVFVEVKSRGNESFGPAVTSIPPSKQRKLVEAARGYLLDKEPGGPERQYRFDVILLHPPESDGKVYLEHITDAFRS